MSKGAEIGSTANSYQVLAKLAVGGMAEIFLARGANATGVERHVVLKRILRDKANDTHFVQMFLEEARLAAQLQHANIAQVYDVGKLGDSYFFTMEYVHGETVRTLLERCSSKQRDIPVSAVLSVLAGTAAGLHHAHERIGLGGKPLNIVHRDVSPSNLIISYEGIVKVVDFGVAKATTSSSHTRVGTVKGKAGYMSPEQARTEKLDRRSDLFSLGIVAWEMLTTRRLFKGPTDFEVMSSIVRMDVPPPSSVRDGIPPEIDALVLRLLAKSPQDRYQTADELGEAVEIVATKLGHQLSAKALARYAREVFGARPEPWVELASSDDALEAVSVTSEPIPPAIVAGMSASDLTLDDLHDHTFQDAMPSITPTPPAPKLALEASGEIDEQTIAVDSLREVTPGENDVLAQVPTLPPRRLQTSPVTGTPPTGSPVTSTPASGAPVVKFPAPNAPGYNQTLHGVTPRTSTPSQPQPLVPRTLTPSQPTPLAPARPSPSQPMPFAMPPMPPEAPRSSTPSQPMPLAYGSQPPQLMPPVITPPVVTFRQKAPVKRGPRPLALVIVGLAVIAAAVASFLLVR